MTLTKWNLKNWGIFEISFIIHSFSSFIKFEENLSAEHKARELKTIHIEAECEFIKMEIQICHINNLNLYNQVGIVAINIMGSICDSEYFLKQLDDPKKISFVKTMYYFSHFFKILIPLKTHRGILRMIIEMLNFGETLIRSMKWKKLMNFQFRIWLLMFTRIEILLK